MFYGLLLLMFGIGHWRNIGVQEVNKKKEIWKWKNLANLMLNPDDNFDRLQEIWNNTPKFKIMLGALN